MANEGGFMNSIIQLTPLQTIFIFAMQLWIFVIFPVIVIRKLNYMTSLLEAQFDQGQDESEAS
jgi:Na+/H+-dicarboxylate symporter